MIDLERYMKFLEDHRITQRQFLLLYCLYKQRIDIIKRYKTLFPAEEGQGMVGAIEFNELLTNGMIERTGDTAGTKSFRVTKKFLLIFVDKHEAIEQLLDAYPKFYTNPTTMIRYPLTTTDEDELKELYARKIKESAQEHLEVMKDVEYAKQNNLITMGILKFIGSKQWLAIRELRAANAPENVSHRPML